METKAKSKQKEQSMQEQQKNVVETESESSKNIDPGEMLQAGLKGRATTEMSTILGERPAPAVEGEYM